MEVDIKEPTASADGEETSWEIEKSQLEQQNFNLNQELNDARDRLQTLANKNSQLVDELGRHGTDLSEASRQRRLLETARNESVEKNIDLENNVARLKIEKEERDNLIANLNKEKQSIMVEMFSLKDQIKQLCEEKSEIAISLEALEQDKKTISFEREKYSSERDMYAESKKWFMQEVSERDNRISSLRLELSNKDMAITSEKLHLESKVGDLELKIEDLTEKLEFSKEAEMETLNRMEEVERSHVEQIANLEAEVRCLKELRSILQNATEEAKQAADKFKDELEAKDSVVNEVQKLLTEVHEEVVREKSVLEAELNKKDDEISRLKVELAQTNELMKSKHAVNVNVTEEELAALSPAAADTARLLRGGQTLSGLVKEQARLAGELAAQKEENAQLMNTLQELVDHLEENGSNFAAQRNLTDSMYDRNERFEKQLEEAEFARKELTNERDSAQRELAFTQVELEKYQRDYELMAKRNSEMMFAAEKMNRANDPSWNDACDQKLFTTIVALQQRNVQLESDIEHEKKSAAQAAMNAQNVEMASLRSELSKSHEAEARLQSQIEQLKTALNVVKDQAEHFKDLVRDSVSATEARNARIKAEEAYAAKVSAEMSVKRLEDLVQVLKEERNSREQEMSQRLEAAESRANNTMQTCVTLEVALKTQTANTAELQQAIQSIEKEIEKKSKEVRELLDLDTKKSQKLIDIGKELMDAHESAGSLRVRVRFLEDELATARSEASYLKNENDIQRSVMKREQELMKTLTEMGSRLSRVENEKLTHSNNQAEVLRLERDSLKASSTRLSDQMAHQKNEAKLMQLKLEQEINLIRQRLAEKEEQFAASENELMDLRSKLASVQAQYTGADTLGMTPDRLKKEYQQLKNRTQFLENQLNEVKTKLVEAEAEKAKRVDESLLVQNHSSILEENLKKTEQLGAMERERLENKANTFEARSEELAEKLGTVRDEYEQLKASYDDSRIESERQIGELKRQLDIVRLQFENIQQEQKDAADLVNKAKEDVAEKEKEVMQNREVIDELKHQIGGHESMIARLQSQLDDKSMALLAETDAKKQADGMRITAERELQKKTEEKEQIEKECREKLVEYDKKIESLAQQYEVIATSVNSLSSVDPNDSLNDINTSVVESNTIESLQNMLQFVRQDKDNAISRAMNSEIEMRRLKAETAEYERGRNELLAKIRDLESEKTANAAALIERAKLIEKVEALTNVQNLNSQLNAERTKLQNALQVAQSQKSELEKKANVALAKYNEINLKLANSTNEAAQRKKEVEMLKQRLETTGRAQASTQQTQLEQARTMLAQAKQEAKTASEQAKIAEQAKLKAEENSKSFQTKFNQTRTLALKYRDELKELKAGAADSNGASASTAPASSAQSNEEVAKLKELVAELQQTVAEKEKKVMEAEMDKIRMNMLESRMTKMTEKLTEVTSERDGLMQNNMRLTRELDHNRATSATDVESSKAASSTDRLVTSKTPITALSTPLASSTPKNADHTELSQASVGSSQKTQRNVLFSGATPTQQVVITQSPNQIPPAPAATQSSSSTVIDKRVSIPSAVPNEPLDVVPPVPSDNVPDPTPPQTNFGLPVPPTFQSSARVPTQSLFSSSSSTTTTTDVTTGASSKISEKKSVLPNIESTSSSSSYTHTAASSSLFGTTSQLFGKSSAPALNISTTSSNVSSDNMVLPEESVAEAAGQSSHVSGSVDDNNKTLEEADLVANDGESRDSLVVSGVSSSDIRRKRAAAEDSDSNEAKRQRESPSEVVTSSESRQQRHNVADIPELDDEVVLEMEQEVSDEDPNETVRQHEIMQGLENDEEVLGDEMEGEEEDDESFDTDEERYAENDNDAEDINDDTGDRHDVVVVDDDDDVIVLESDDDQDHDNDQDEEEEEEEGDEDEDDADTLNDLEDDNDDEDDNDQEEEEDDVVEESHVRMHDVAEVLGGEDSQPSLDDQDREAASAVEEAEDEGRDSLMAPIDEAAAPADPTGASSGIGSSGESQPDVPRLRMSGMLNLEERDDQCSSSNETADASSPTIQQRHLTARNLARLQRPVRGGKQPSRGIYQVKRGGGRRDGPGSSDGAGPSGTA